MKQYYEEIQVPVIILYNWKLLKKYTDNNPHKMLEFFNNVYIKKTENYFYLNPWAAKIVAESKNNANNYIQNARELILASSGATDSEIFVYLDLCSKRSYFNFLNTKGSMNYIPEWKIDNYNVESLKMNRLLTYDDNNIYLLYETGD